MAGNAYPHIVFAKNAEVLPQQTLADLLVGLFPDATVEQGEIKAELRLADDYTTTFWYDDEAEGLGDRYADFAAPLRRKRVTRCTTMIDASGESDPDGTHARDVARIMAALAEREGVYVFSEETRRFVGMDYDDDPGVTAPADPAADLRSEASYAPHAEAGARDVVLQGDEVAAEVRHTEERPVDLPRETAPVPAPTPVHEPTVTEEPVRPTAGTPAVEPVREPSSGSTVAPEPTTTTGPISEPVAPEATAPQADRPATPAPAAPAPDSPASPGTPVEPVTADRQEVPAEKKGFFKKLFGRKG